MPARPTAISAPTSPRLSSTSTSQSGRRPLARLDLAAVERDLEIGSADLDAERAAANRRHVDGLERRHSPARLASASSSSAPAAVPACSRDLGHRHVPARVARTRHRFLETLGRARAGGLDRLLPAARSAAQAKRQRRLREAPVGGVPIARLDLLGRRAALAQRRVDRRGGGLARGRT